MQRYLSHIQTKEPHQRRQHAMQLSGAITAAIFVVWITTLGLRLGSSTQLAQEDDANQTSLSAAAAQATLGGPNQLIVAPTSGF